MPSTTLTYTGADQSVTVPLGCTTANVYMWGGGGGSNGAASGGDMARGGAGGFVKFTINVTAGETLIAKVGRGGRRTASVSRGPGSGGGMSALLRNSTYLGIAGGGGGGGGYGDGNTDSWGGAGGDLTANNGESNLYASGGGAGTATSGGSGGTPGPGIAGSYLQGGNGSGSNTTNLGGWPNGGDASIDPERGGGGGGGYYGGGGGGGTGTWGSGGGGGSSYTIGTATAVTHIKGTANGITAPGNTETGYAAGIAVPGSDGTESGNGLIYINWLITTTSSVSGTVLDSNSSPASRIVRVHSRTDGAVLGSTTSDQTTGAFLVNVAVAENSDVQVVCLDDSGGSLENDIIYRVLTGAAVYSYITTNLVAVLDAKEYASGQLWTNSIVSPADGSAQTAYDYQLGGSTSADSDDPSINALGTDAAYFSFDGGDYFSLNLVPASASEFLRTMHHAGKKWTIEIWMQWAGSPGGNISPMFDSGSSDQNGSDLSRGVIFGDLGSYTGSTNKLKFRVKQDSNAVNAWQRDSSSDLPSGSPQMIAISWDATGAEASFLYRNGNYESSTGTGGAGNTWTVSGATFGTADAAQRSRLGARGDGLFPVPNGTRVYLVRLYNRNLTKAELDVNWNGTKSRFPQTSSLRWDPAAAYSWTLSLSNRRATTSNQANDFVFTPVFKSSGKWFTKLRVVTLTASGFKGYALVTSNASLPTGYLVADNTGVLYAANFSGTVPTFGTGTDINVDLHIAFDVDAKKAWIGVNGLPGDPAAGTGNNVSWTATQNIGIAGNSNNNGVGTIVLELFEEFSISEIPSGFSVLE